MSLSDEHITRAMRELCEAAPNGINEDDALTALRELNDTQVSAALWELWETGHTAISWKDGELYYASVKPYRAADDLAPMNLPATETFYPA